MMRRVVSSIAPAAARRMGSLEVQQQLSHGMRRYRPFSTPLDAFSRSSGLLNGGASSFNRFSVASFSTGDESAPDKASEGEDAPEEDTQQQAAADGEADGGSDKEPTAEEIIAELKEQVKEKHEHMMMAYANEQNALRIAEDDVAKARQFAVQGFAKNLLEVADNLHRAREAVPPEAVDEDGNEMLKQLLEGVKMTEDGLLKVFAQNGIEAFGEVGDKFDSNIHEALYMYQDPTGEPGTLGQVVSIGYMLKDRVLRPAKAGIINAPKAVEDS